MLRKMGVLALAAVAFKHSMHDFSQERRLVTAARDASLGALCFS